MKRLCFVTILSTIILFLGNPFAYADEGCQKIYDKKFEICVDKAYKKFKKEKEIPSGKEVEAVTHKCIKKAQGTLFKCHKGGKKFKKAWAKMEKDRKKCRSSYWKKCWKKKDQIEFVGCIAGMKWKCDWDKLEKKMLKKFESK